MIAGVESSDMSSWSLPDIIREQGLWPMPKLLVPVVMLDGGMEAN